MAEKSLKSNFVFNLINVVSGLLFPLITFPYASRILMAEGIGQVQFFSSIVNYVILLTSLGIPMYGIRQIARVRDDAKELVKTTVELISLNLILNLLGYIIVAVLCLTVYKIQVNIPLFLVLSLSIILTTIGCPWFFSGIEEFKYVTIRSLVVKVIAVVFLFAFVKEQSDVLWYGVYTILTIGGCYLWNFICLRRYLDFKLLSFRDLNLAKHIKPTFEVFVLNLITSIYLNLDTVMLGFLKDSEAVGYYTAATKLSHILLTVVVSLGTVMLPRLSNLAEVGDDESFKKLSGKSYDFILMLAFPITAGLIILAPTLINLFCGPSFSYSIHTLRVISPIVIAIGISNLIGIQILYPKGKTNLVIISTAIGALINFTLNLILIPNFAQDGAAIATVVAEFGVTLTQIIIAKKYIPFNLVNRHLFKCLFGTLIMTACCLPVMFCNLSDGINVFLVPAIGIVVYVIGMFLSKDAMVQEMITLIKSKVISAN